MLQIKEIKKTYPGFTLQASLEVSPGRIVGLIGANGAGKSTLFKSILGLVRTDSISGTILGKDAAGMKDRDREQIGTVLSESGFCGYLTIGNVKKILKTMYPSFREDMFDEKARAFGLDYRKQVKELSTGMKARLKVLAAMSHQPRLLLLDEPTAGLDVVARDEVYSMIRSFMEESEERAVLISSHISADLERLCDEFYMIDNGQMILHESADALMSEYGILKVTAKDYEKLDRTYLLKKRKEAFGYTCLTDQLAFYRENAPELVIEKAGLDELIMLMIRGETI